MIPFKQLLSPKTKFLWTNKLTEAFERSKAAIVEAIRHGVQIFDPSLEQALDTSFVKNTVIVNSQHPILVMLAEKLPSRDHAS